MIDQLRIDGGGERAGSTGPTGRVLVVDDEVFVAKAYSKVLGYAGCSVEVALSGAEAGAQLAHTAFDVVVADIMMPETSGIDLLRTVRERDPDVPVILVTGNPTLSTAQAAIEYGASRYLSKPVDNEELLQVVHHAIRLRRMAALKRQALEVISDETRAISDRAGLETRFGAALGQLWMAYQPIVSCSDRRVVGYEALVRCREPVLRGPAELFDAAERLGRVHELGRAIRAQVAGAMERLPADVTMFLNLHASDLGDLELTSETSPLTAHADCVVLEITERASLDGVEGVRTRVATLRDLGFRIAVDDLGAGYAGLSSFTQLEPDVVKLDMSLIRGLDKSSRKRSIVRSMLQLAGGELGILAVCEGVETAEERDTLMSLGADLCQGYLFAKPSPDFVVPVL